MHMNSSLEDDEIRLKGLELIGQLKTNVQTLKKPALIENIQKRNPLESKHPSFDSQSRDIKTIQEQDDVLHQ